MNQEIENIELKLKKIKKNSNNILPLNKELIFFNQKNNKNLHLQILFNFIIEISSSWIFAYLIYQIYKSLLKENKFIFAIIIIISSLAGLFNFFKLINKKYIVKDNKY